MKHPVLQKFAIKLLNGKATEIESFLLSIIFTPKKKSFKSLRFFLY